MTLAQAAAAVGGDAETWKGIAQGLLAILGGILGFTGQRVIRTMDALSAKVEQIFAAVNEWNGERLVWQSQIEARVEAGEAESTNQHDRLALVERRRPR